MMASRQWPDSFSWVWKHDVSPALNGPILQFFVMENIQPLEAKDRKSKRLGNGSCHFWFE